GGGGEHPRRAARCRRRSRSVARACAGAPLDADDAHAGAPAFRAPEHHRADAARRDHPRPARGPSARPHSAASPYSGPRPWPRLRTPACSIPACERVFMTKAYDALIIGAGHNGLVCAFYLAKAGQKVRIVEARDVVGGAAVTEEFAPGFRNSVASYTVSLLQPKVIADMKLADHGYRVIERPISNFLPQEDGGYLKL